MVLQASGEDTNWSRYNKHLSLQINMRIPFTFYVKHDQAFFFFFFVWIISVVRSWPGFWQEMDSRWINKSQKQTSNDSWKNEIRHHVIFCSIRLVKTRKSELLIQCYCLEFCVKRNKFLVFFRDAWKGPIFFQHNRVFQRGIGDPLTFHSHPHVKESTFQLCRLRS